MIRKEYYMTREDGVRLFINYSDKGFKILQQQTGIVYDVAFDVENAPYTYSETGDKIEVVEEENNETESL
jgi:hypothetical protein